MPNTLIAPVGSIAPMRAVRIETTDDIVRAAAAQFKGCIKRTAKQLAPGNRELRKDHGAGGADPVVGARPDAVRCGVIAAICGRRSGNG